MPVNLCVVLRVRGSWIEFGKNRPSRGFLMSRLVPEGPPLLDPIREDFFTMYSDLTIPGKKVVSRLNGLIESNELSRRCTDGIPLANGFLRPLQSQ